VLINYYNNGLDSVLNTSGFHGLFTSPLAILNKVIDIATQLGILSPLNEATITNEKEEKVAEEDHIINSTTPFKAAEVEGSLAHENFGHRLGFDHSNRRADPYFDALNQGLIQPTSDTFNRNLLTSIMVYHVNK